jgi:hypothetical protein
MLANLYVTTRMDNPAAFLTANASTITQLSFFFAGLLALIVFVFGRLTSKDDAAGSDRLVGFIVVVLILGVALFADIPGTPPTSPKVCLGMTLPTMDGLLVVRVALVLFAVYITARPAPKNGGK